MAVEGAEGAVSVTDIRVVNISVDQVGDVRCWIVTETNRLCERCQFRKLKKVPELKRFYAI